MIAAMAVEEEVKVAEEEEEEEVKVAEAKGVRVNRGHRRLSLHLPRHQISPRGSGAGKNI